MCDQLTEDIREKCFDLCSKYIWLNISRSDVSYERITGGVTNQMINCKLLDKSDETIDGKLKQIALKLYRKDRPLDSDNNTQNAIFNDMVIGLIVSERGLGPKIYGLSGDAVIMEYIECHQFDSNDQKNELIVEELGRKLAKVHSLEPPVNRRIQWISETFTESNVNSYKKSPNSKIIEENNLNNLIENDFENEFRLLMKSIDDCNSPIVFSHNDFGFCNILVRNQTKNNELKERVVLSDFEFSSYGFRGRDFGLVFDDWLDFNGLTYDRNCQTIIEPFLKSYLSESIRIVGQNYANNEFNSLQHLIKESKVFLLLQKLFSVLYFLNAEQTIFPKLNKTEIMIEANELFGKYLQLKQIMIEENVIKV